MSDGTSLGDRMKAYERPYRQLLPRRTYTIIRVDGRAFHSLLKHAKRPYDADVMACMDYVALSLCEEVQGARLAFVQSDEVSVLLTDFESTGTQPWFGGVLAKMVSVSASIATLEFNDFAGDLGLDLPDLAQFDSRVFTVPDPVEVANSFIWRQQDATRNSILMAGQSVFSRKELQGKNTNEIQEMLWQQHGINWNDYPEGFKRGRVCIRQEDAPTGWAVVAAPVFKAEPGTFLADVIPPMPSLHGE
jgi:tRNA(His) 5'-end guanylyltransferase